MRCFALKFPILGDTIWASRGVENGTVGVNNRKIKHDNEIYYHATKTVNVIFLFG